MGNMDLYTAFRSVPQDAKKTIGAGKLKGFTDINPMWRIKMLTQQFGVCGFGWKIHIDKQWLEKCESTNEVKAFCNVSLYIKIGEQWSEAIEGTGGSSFVSSTRNGLDVSDEAYKMAFTDAISICCKSLGMAADVYFDKDRTKYDQASDVESPAVKSAKTPTPTAAQGTTSYVCSDADELVVCIMNCSTREEVRLYSGHNKDKWDTIVGGKKVREWIEKRHNEVE